MIRHRNIVCFASNWHYHPTSKHHIMRRLSEENNVVWVNWHASRRPRLGWSDLRAILSRLRQIRSGPQRISGSLTSLTPCQLPFPASRLARQLNAEWVGRAVRKVLSRLPDWPTQLWSFAPDVSDLVGAFNEELVLYYCVDAFGEFTGYDCELIERRERELMARSDIVVTTSPPLYEAKRRLHPNVHFIQHGVDHAHLSKAVHQVFTQPRELAALPRPILGFVGVVGDWVDLDLVAGLARAWPQASIVMIGPELTPRGACAGLRNVRWLGGREHGMLPEYLQYFDVGLIPFRQTALTYNANPIKLYEYLAAGVPVVSTSLPAVAAVPGSVWLADEVESMAQACRQAIRHNTQPERHSRSELMICQSWSARLEQIGSLIADTTGQADHPTPMAPASTVEHHRVVLQTT